MDNISLPQDDLSFTEWLSATNYQEPDALPSDFDFMNTENINFTWPQETSSIIPTENNTLVLNRLEAVVIRVEQSTQQACENIRGVSSQVYQVHELVTGTCISGLLFSAGAG
ncbi:hypothetical protein LA080_011827 [Diaporthe eres]|nr:hypothetical protein LA080_011827 [Diaporthe eres]